MSYNTSSILQDLGLDYLSEQQIKNLVVFLQMITDAEITFNKPKYHPDKWDVPQRHSGGPYSLNGLHPFMKIRNGKCLTGKDDYIIISGGGPAIGRFQIEPMSWCDYGFRDKPITPQNQVDFVIQKLQRQPNGWSNVINGRWTKARSAYAGVWRAFDKNSKYNTGAKFAAQAIALGGRTL